MEGEAADAAIAAGPKPLMKEGRDINTLFLEGQQLVEKTEELDSSSSEFKEALTRGLQILQNVETMARSMALISSNEEVDDISTTDLKYVLLDHYLAQLLQKVPGRGNERRGALIGALRHLDVFMSRCQSLGLLKGDDLKAWEAEGEEGEDDSPAGRRRTPAVDPAAARQRKIERFRREKAAKDRLREVNVLLRRLAKEGEDADILGEKEEAEREKVLLWMDTCIRKSLDDRDMIKQELEILDMVAKTQPPDADGTGGRDDRRGVNEPQGGSVQPKKPLTVTHLDAVGGQLRIRQEEIRARVFQPGYNLPTMTLEELADIEMQRAKEAEEREKSAPQGVRRYDQLVADGEEEDEELVEKAAYKDREWDDWKDEHPFGSGNKADKLF